MKIALAGAPCTGKTTLGRALSQKLNIPFVEESLDGALQQCIDHGCKMSKSTVESWPEYFERVWKFTGYHSEIINFGKGIVWDVAEKERAAGDSFVSDSAPPSQAAAALLYGCFIQDQKDLQEWYIQRMNKSRIYDVIFYLPVLSKISFVDEERRLKNVNVQMTFDWILNSIISQTMCPTDYLWMHELDKRVEYVMKRIAKYDLYITK